MLIRIAIAISEDKQEKKLVYNLTGISIVMKVEFDISIYSKHFDKLIDNFKNIDIFISDFKFLRDNREKISELYVANINCLPILIGGNEINEYLIVRPIEYINKIDDITPENKNDKIRTVCDFYIYLTQKRFEQKIDNSVIHITTRQECYAIPKESILYCQSDLKYSVFVCDDGMVVRKLDKLQTIHERYLWDFKRVHQSFLVNPQRIEGVDKVTNEIILSNNIRIPFSRKYAGDVHDLFNN